MKSTTSWGGVPLWLRNIDYEYGLPLWQGKYAILDNEAVEIDIEPYKGTINDLKNSVQSLLKKTNKDLELLLMRSLVIKYFAPDRDHRNNESVADYKFRIKQFSDFVHSADTSMSFINKFASYVIEKTSEDRFKYIFHSIINKSILTQETLDYFKTNKFPEVLEEKKERTIGYIQRRLKKHDVIESRIPDQKASTTFTKQQLNEFRETLKNMYGKREWRIAFEALTIHSPSDISDWLVSWKKIEKSWRDRGMGYQLGSYFGMKCKDDRLENLTKLLKAKNDYIKVAAAVYLSLDGDSQGLESLKKFKTLKKDPGIWASLTLARRGDKKALEYSLAAFSREKDGAMHGTLLSYLKLRILVLLSNSAAKSKIPQPPHGTYRKVNYKLLKAWWRKHRDDIEIYDPWLPQLVEQKVD